MKYIFYPPLNKSLWLKPLLISSVLLFSNGFSKDVNPFPPLGNNEWSEESKDIYELLVAKFNYSQALYEDSVISLFKLAEKDGSDQLYAKALNAAMRTYQYELALDIINSWQAKSDRELLGYKIYILVLANKNDEAIQLTEEYIQRDSNELVKNDKLSNLAGTLQKNWDNTSVLAFSARLYEMYPDNQDLTYLYINLLRFNGESEAAVKIIDKLLFANPKSIDNYILKSDIYRYDIKIDKANEVWSQLLEDYPSESMFKFRYAQYLYDSYQFEKCVEVLLAIDYDVVKTQKKVLLSMALLQLNQVEKAEAAFEFATLEDGELDKAYFQFASLLEQNKLYDKATEYLQKVDVNGDNGMDARLMMVSNIYRQDIAKGNEIFAQIAKDYVIEGMDEINYKGFALEKAERYDEAINLYSEFLQKESKNTDALYRRSLAYDMLGEGDKAIADLQRLLEIDPNNDAAKNALGYTMISYGYQLDEAIKLIENAMFDDPWSAAVVDSMGWGRYFQKNYTQANKYLFYSYSNMIDGEVIGHYVRSLYDSGDIEKAKTIYQFESKYLKDDKKLEKYIHPIKAALTE